MIDDLFGSMLNWKLKRGSHEFPGEDGGTCVNEAAIVAAGLPYRQIDSAEDCPPCFSRPIAEYALALNDHMHSRTRQKLLMPFVVRLAGTADAPAIERARKEFLIEHTVGRVWNLAIPLGFSVFKGISEMNAEQILKLLATQRLAAATNQQYREAYVIHRLENNLAGDITRTNSLNIGALVTGVAVVADVLHMPMRVYKRAVNVLDGAIQMGRNSSITEAEARVRLDYARAHPEETVLDNAHGELEHA